MRKVPAGRVFLLCVLKVLIAAVACAQEPVMKHYTVNEGLASNSVYAILSDSKGFLWFCTDAGVSRFDGYKFSNFSLSDGLSDNEMLGAYEDSKARIWFLGFNGTLSYYFNGKFFNPNNDSLLKKIKSQSSFLYFFEDKQHRLWFTTNKEYIIVDGDNIQRIIRTPQNKIGPEGIVMNNTAGTGTYILTQDDTNNTIDPLHSFTGTITASHKIRYAKKAKSGFCHLNEGGILFTASEGIVWQKDTVQKLLLPTGKEFEHMPVQTIFVSSNNRLWISTAWGGVLSFDRQDLNKNSERYLRDNNTCDIREDLEGNIWISTLDNGVYMLPGGPGDVKNYNDKNGLSFNQVYSVSKSDGNIYAGSDKGLAVMISKDIVKPLLLSKDIIPYNRIVKIISKSGNIWLGSDEFLMYLDMKKNIHCKLNYGNKQYQVGAVKDISLRKDKVAVCISHSVFQNNGDIYSSCGKPLDIISQNDRRIYCVYVAHNGTIWYGAKGGLYSYDGRENAYHSWNGMDQEIRINSIAETGDSVLVLATYGHGIFFFRNDKIQEHLTLQNGIGSDICKRVFVCNNEVYISTTNGATLIKYTNSKSEVIKNYTTADGILSNDVNDIFADDSEILIATSGGLSVLNRNAPHIAAVPPPLYISGIRNNGILLPADSNYTFSHQQNRLHFDFTGISYQLANEVIYQYKLSDIQPWLETRNNSIDFPFLPPGNYHFQLRARTFNSPWSKARSVYFSISPPFWKTYWFITLCSLLFLAFVILSFRYFIRRAKHKHAEELKIKDEVAQLKQQALQAMMNPHFIFNVINSIQYCINNNALREANTYLSDFASLIRMNLDISSRRYIPLDDEIGYLELYLSLESLRFGSRLTYSISIDPAIDGDETMIPVMMLQPFIENAIWHGILPKTGNGHVQVNINKEQDMLKVRITDNGVGMPDLNNETTRIKTHQSKGMSITQKRLDLIGRITGHALYIRITDAFPEAKYRGTAVEILLPGDLT